MQQIAKCECQLSFFLLLRFKFGSVIEFHGFCLIGDQLFLGANEPLAFTHYQEIHRGLPTGRENTDLLWVPL